MRRHLFKSKISLTSIVEKSYIFATFQRKSYFLEKLNPIRIPIFSETRNPRPAYNGIQRQMLFLLKRNG
jgi:hypothetical protein